MKESSDTDPGFFDRLAAGGKKRGEELSRPGDDVDHIDEAEQASLENAMEETAQSDLEQGRLASDARRALVELMRNGVVMADAKPGIFELLCRYQPLIEDHLADMYLRLLIDPSAGIALLLQQQSDEESDEEESSALIYRRTLSLFDTLLLLVLRKHYQKRQTAGEQQVIIDIERIEAQLTPFLPLTNSSRIERRKLNGAINKMKDRKLLASVRGDDERFEITPVICYVVNAEFLEHLLTQYRDLVDQVAKDQSEES